MNPRTNELVRMRTDIELSLAKDQKYMEILNLHIGRDYDKTKIELPEIIKYIDVPFRDKFVITVTYFIDGQPSRLEGRYLKQIRLLVNPTRYLLKLQIKV